jgi:hypothetical protein
LGFPPGKKAQTKVDRALSNGTFVWFLRGGPDLQTPRGSLRSGPSVWARNMKRNELMESGEQSYESERKRSNGGFRGLAPKKKVIRLHQITTSRKRRVLSYAFFLRPAPRIWGS